jgi:GlcNAc-P-P-Und epimerase
MNPTYLLTGAHGFLGRHINSHLSSSGSRVTTLGKSDRNDITCNLSTAIPIIQVPVDVVVHAAGKAHSIPRTETEQKAFFDVNLTGTQHLCKALETLPQLPTAFVFISTIAVYGVDTGENINERHPLLGTTPYAQSKIGAEAFLQNWCADKNVKLSILRLPLIAGAVPPGNLGAMINGIQKGRYFNIGGGAARKSVVMADDVAAAIPVITQTAGIYNLTDGQHPSFAQLANVIAKQSGKPTPKNLPRWLAKLAAFAGDFLGSQAPINTDKLRKITGTLTFDDSKARNSFGWKPKPVLDAFKIS